MNRLMQWVMAAALICSSTVFTSCSKSGSDDVQEPVVKPDPVVNPEQPDDNGANSSSDEVEPTQSSTLALVTASHLGWLVGSDGKAYDPTKGYMPIGVTAVGILGKVTATGKGLILALKDAKSQDWYTIDGWTSVTTYAGTTLKQLPDDAARGSLTSYTTLGSTTVSDWCVGQKSDYEAIFINLGSAKYDHSGYTYDANVNAYITTGVGGTALYDRYWSATDYGGNYGWGFSDYFWDGVRKSGVRSLRPVLGF